MGCATAYYLNDLLLSRSSPSEVGSYEIYIIEREHIGAGASGKAGGFLARDWGEELHRVSFDLHEELSKSLRLSSYRRLATLKCVANQQRFMRKRGGAKQISPEASPYSSLVDGDGVHKLSVLDSNTAQVTPLELTTALLETAMAPGNITVIIDSVKHVSLHGDHQVRVSFASSREDLCVDKVVVSLGPWSILASTWFHEISGFSLPMHSYKSSSLVYKSYLTAPSSSTDSPPHACLFCEDDDND